MQILETYEPFNIQEIELIEWERRTFKNNFFEFVLIKKGTGTQCIDYNFHMYREGSMFLLPPLKCHEFQIKEPTTFVFVKFTSNFFTTNNQGGPSHEEWFKEAAYILSNYNQLPGDIINIQTDRQHIYSLIDLILTERRNYPNGSDALIKSLMTSILEILLRNIKQNSTNEVITKNENDTRIIKILTYIDGNIDKPEQLTIEQLANTFLLSPTYVSEYFQKKMKVSLREYIIKARLKLVEIRLLNSDYTLKEISNEFGFTDASHLSKIFKKYAGISIREFKERGEYQLLQRSI